VAAYEILDKTGDCFRKYIRVNDTGMKILHAADLHIDSAFRGLSVRPAELAPEFRQATRRALQNLIDLCLRERVALLLVAGDVFDGNCQDACAGEFFLEQLNRLRDVGTQVALVYGNHDAECSVIRRLRMPDHVHRMDTACPETRVFEQLGVAVHGQSYARREIWDNLARRYPRPVAHVLNIGLLHTNAIAYVNDPLYAPCTVRELVEKDYDYWALGHIHWHDILHERPWVAYAGNIQARYMEEAGPKGCILIECEGPEIVCVRQILVDAVRWAKVRVAVDAQEISNEDVAQVQLALRKAQEDAGGRPLVASVVIQGEAPYGSRSLSAGQGTAYRYRVREFAASMHRLLIEDIVVESRNAPSFDAEPFACHA